LELNHAQSVLQSELSQEQEVVKSLERRVKDLEQGQLKLETLELQIQEYQHKISVRLKFLLHYQLRTKTCDENW